MSRKVLWGFILSYRNPPCNLSYTNSEFVTYWDMHHIIVHKLSMNDDVRFLCFIQILFPLSITGYQFCSIYSKMWMWHPTAVWLAFGKQEDMTLMHRFWPQCGGWFLTTPYPMCQWRNVCSISFFNYVQPCSAAITANWLGSGAFRSGYTGQKLQRHSNALTQKILVLSHTQAFSFGKCHHCLSFIQAWLVHIVSLHLFFHEQPQVECALLLEPSMFVAALLFLYTYLPVCWHASPWCHASEKNGTSHSCWHEVF